MFVTLKLQKICFFIFLGTLMLLCIINVFSRLDNVRSSLNIVTDSLIPFKNALCMNYNDNTLYSLNGKLQLLKY